MTGLSVVAYELGTFKEGGDPRVVMGFVVRHRDGVIVVDTGFGFGHPELDLHYEIRAKRVRDALAEVEVRPDEISGLINCHLHADHSGQNRDFPGIPTWVQPLEWTAAHAPDHTIVEWIDYERLRLLVPLSLILSHYGLDAGLKRVGSQLVGCCPIHKGSNRRAFVVNLHKNVWHCFGGCGGGGALAGC